MCVEKALPPLPKAPAGRHVYGFCEPRLAFVHWKCYYYPKEKLHHVGRKR